MSTDKPKRPMTRKSTLKPQESLTPEEVKAIRGLYLESQVDFARRCGTNARVYQEWERKGLRAGPSVALLHLLRELAQDALEGFGEGESEEV